jgi:hypothetical protein
MILQEICADSKGGYKVSLEKGLDKSFPQALFLVQLGLGAGLKV